MLFSEGTLVGNNTLAVASKIPLYAEGLSNTFRDLDFEGQIRVASRVGECVEYLLTQKGGRFLILHADLCLESGVESEVTRLLQVDSDALVWGIGEKAAFSVLIRRGLLAAWFPGDTTGCLLQEEFLSFAKRDAYDAGAGSGVSLSGPAGGTEN